MKKLTTLLAAISLTLSGFAYTWDPLAPDSANITRFAFGVGLPYFVMCSDDGMYLYNYSTQECEFYNYGLPVKGAAWYSFDKMLLVMGDGSYSDGIWTFDFNTHEFEVVEWYPNPNFLIFDDFNNTWWAGFQFGGIMKSSDGSNWEEVPYFDGRSPYCMDYYGEKLVVSEVSNIYGVHYSGDGGETWQETTGPDLMISDMDFDGNGVLLGVMPGPSFSSGIWKSEDFGESWEVLFYAWGLSSVCHEVFGDLFVGWEETWGIARYVPNVPPTEFIYLNEGLSSTNINSIQVNPTMSAPAIFVATDQGAYMCYDYMVGVNEPEYAHEIQIGLFPNPARDKIFIECETEINSLKIFNASTKLIFEQSYKGNQLIVDVSLFSPGIYFFEVTALSGKLVRKILIQ